MSNGKEQMQIEFHDRATAIFFSIYHAFEIAISNLSRRNEEYRFQQLKKQYAGMMEQELQSMAKNVLMKSKNEKQVKETDQMFYRLIKSYLHRFIQKVNDL